MRCSPQVGFSAAKRRIKALTSAVTGGLPTGLDFQRQKRRSALRCQPIIVAGLTISNALRPSNQPASLENTNLSAGVVAVLSSPVPGLEPIVCAKTNSQLPA